MMVVVKEDGGVKGGVSRSRDEGEGRWMVGTTSRKRTEDHVTRHFPQSRPIVIICLASRQIAPPVQPVIVLG